MDLIDLVENGRKNRKGYRYILVAIDKFSKVGWTVRIKNKNAQLSEDSFGNILESSKRKSKFFETDDGKNLNKPFTDSSIKNKIRKNSRYSSEGAVFAERFNICVKIFLKEPVFGKSPANFIDELNAVTKMYNRKKPSSTKSTPNEASIEKNE